MFFKKKKKHGSNILQEKLENRKGLKLDQICQPNQILFFPLGCLHLIWLVVGRLAELLLFCSFCLYLFCNCSGRWLLRYLGQALDIYLSFMLLNKVTIIRSKNDFILVSMVSSSTFIFLISNHHTFISCFKGNVHILSPDICSG